MRFAGSSLMSASRGGCFLFVTKSAVLDQSLSGMPTIFMGLLLEPLDELGPFVHFETFETAEEARTGAGEIYKVQLEVRGNWTDHSSHAVFAEWQVGDTAQADAFVENRRQLFELRQRVLPTFAVDWLLRRVDDACGYLVLGLYGDEEGLRLCRDHPAIRRFGQDHPAAAFGAKDVSGLHFFRIRHAAARSLI